MPPNANVLNDLIVALRRHSEAWNATIRNRRSRSQENGSALFPGQSACRTSSLANVPKRFAKRANLALYRGSLRKALKLAETSCHDCDKARSRLPVDFITTSQSADCEELALPDAEEQLRQAETKIDRDRTHRS